MGLDFSHGEAHWAYSGFMRFRKMVCEAAGLGDLEDREWFGGDVPWPPIEQARARKRLKEALGQCQVAEPAPGHYWRVSERNTPHLVYCMRQATWRGPFETLNAAKADVLREGYQYADPCDEAEFKEEPQP